MQRHGVRREKSGWASMLLLAVMGLCANVPVSGPANGAEPESGELQARVGEKLKEVQAWARDPVLVAAVKAHNQDRSERVSAMNEDEWKKLSVLDPFVRSLARNAAADFLRARRSEVISEAFISGTNGTKVTFLAKSSSWSHQGKAKHEVPMSGRIWEGPVELDASTGLRQLQVAVPVMDGAVPIGSLVVGLSITRLGASAR